MTLSPNRQQENEVKIRCSEKIIEVKEVTSLKIIEIAAKLKVRYETISRATAEKFYAALKLVK